MTLATAIIGGLSCGYLLGLGRRGFGVLLAIWVVVLTVQTLFVVPTEDQDALYWPVQAAILVVASVMIWLGAKVRVWRARAA